MSEDRPPERGEFSGIRALLFAAATALGSVPGTAAYITAEATANDPTSLAFLISASVIALFCAGSLYALWHTSRRARSAPAGAASPAECTSANAPPV
ncbi:hypothetical protein [Streptomyces lavendulocolor]|uniref:hypothetical protein n=1 Tax=Streptomyces lavendulocolor TaxID=67316 RepID=UPI003C2F1FFA